jgi:hypothetical protein
MGGHLFIIDGDLTKLACDAILIPTDEFFSITKHWTSFLNRTGRWREVDELIDLGWGQSNMLPLPPKNRRPRIWLGNIGESGDTADFGVFAPKVQEFIATALAEHQRQGDVERISNWSKPRLALPVIGTGHGGGAKRKGDLILGLVEKLADLARDPKLDADIVLVTFGEKDYAAAQRARRKLLRNNPEESIQTHWQFDDQPTGSKLIAKAKSLATTAIDSHLVLFLGAGVSAGAGLPNWPDLLRDIAKGANFAPGERFAKLDYRDQATILKRQLELQNRNLGKTVAESLARPHYSLAHGLLASLPSREAVTTNYDTLFEEAWSTARQKVAVLPNQPAHPNGRWLLKLHGCLTRPEKIVITRADYLDMPRQHGALMGLVQGLLMMRHMMFVGYSLSDEDFQELVHEVRRAIGHQRNPKPIGTVLTLETDPLTKELWAKDLEVIPVTSQESKLTPEARSRQLEMFLDLVAYLATTSAAFFLDKSYNDVSNDEEPLRDDLSQLFWRLHEEYVGKPDDDLVAKRVLRFLKEELGAGSRATKRRRR